VRTIAEGATKTAITKDFTYLMRLWKTIKSRVMEVEAPHLLYKERNLVVRTIRDYFTSDVSEILVDDPAVYQEIRDFIKIISPKQTKIVKQHKAAKPIFTRFQLENQIATVYESRVPLKSGGSIVIAQTEALVAIDVNSGKATQKGSIEETALLTNLEAVEEVARQLRLRDLGGLIVVDLIDMRDRKNRSEVERAMKTHLKESIKLAPKWAAYRASACLKCHGSASAPPLNSAAISNANTAGGRARFPRRKPLASPFCAN
jgi:ribonuclease E